MVLGRKKKTIPDSNQGPLKPSYLRTPADKNLTSEAEEDRVSHSAADFDHLPEKIRKMKPWQERMTDQIPMVMLHWLKEGAKIHSGSAIDAKW